MKIRIAHDGTFTGLNDPTQVINNITDISVNDEFQTMDLIPLLQGMGFSGIQAVFILAFKGAHQIYIRQFN